MLSLCTGLPSPVAKDGIGNGEGGKKGSFQCSEKDFVRNMKSAGAWDDSRIIVTKGWFNETAAVSAVKQISFLRLDGDLYVSTWDAIVGFYDRVVPGGLIYVDDYGAFNGCREAINDFRTQRRIYETMHTVSEGNIGYEAVWWRKSTSH